MTRPLPLARARAAKAGPAPTPLCALSRSRTETARGRELWAGVHLPGISAQQLGELAISAQRFTPRVSLAPPDGLLLEVQGSLHLFSGPEGLRAELTGECLRLEARPVVAFAPAPLAALVAARAHRPVVVRDPAQLIGPLAPLPLASLRWPDEVSERLARMGVRTIGAALRLPRAGFARRFGTAPLALLDALTGRTPQAYPGFRAPARFCRRRELGCELENQALLLAALEPLLAALGAFLEAHQCGVPEFECRLSHRQAPATRCVVRLAAPAAQVERLRALLAEHLSALRLPEPVRALELRADELIPLRQGSHALWQPGEHGGSAGDEGCGLLERLRARLGSAAVHGLTELATHRPESAWAASEPPPSVRQRGAAEAGRTAAREGRRPLWLLPAPQPLPVRDGLPRRRGPLRLVSEPERIETGWWDGGEIARDYYTAVDLHGVRLWVFRERSGPHGWFLHGVFG